MNLPYKSAIYWVILVIAVTALGFWPRYFSSISTASIAFHVHGITATAWILLVGFQSWSIHYKRRKWHRIIGKMSLALFPFLAAGFIMIINVSAEGYLNVNDPYYHKVGPSFAWGLGVAYFAYLWLFFQALRHRRNVNLHAAYMLSTLFLVWEAPVSRLILGFVPAMSVGGPEDFYKISYAIIIGIVMAMLFAIYLYIQDPARRKPFLVTAIFMAVQIAGFLYLAEVDTRNYLFTIYAQLSPIFTVGVGFALGVIAAVLGWKFPARRTKAIPEFS